MLIYLFLPMILFLGIMTSYEDIKYGKIRNKWILLSISYAILVYLYLFVFDNVYQLNTTFILNLLLNSALALIVGFLMWNIGLWKAGDAKLLFAYTVLIPINIHRYFSFVNLLVNAFIPISLFLLLYLMLKINNKEKLIYLKKTLNTKTITSIMLFIFGISWAIKLLLQFLGLKVNIVLLLFFILLIYYVFERILEFKMNYLSLLLSFLRFILDKSIYSLNFLYNFLLLIFLFFIMRIFTVLLSSRYFVQELRLNQLKKGMIPAELIFKFKGKYLKRQKRFSIISLTRKKKTGQPLFSPSQGLSKENIDVLKSLQKRLPFKTLKIQATMPFAPFLFLGALLTIIFHGSFVTAIFS